MPPVSTIQAMFRSGADIISIPGFVGSMSATRGLHLAVPNSDYILLHLDSLTIT